MTNHICVAYAQGSANGSHHAVSIQNATLRRRLATLWMSQTLSNMLVIGISQRDAIQIVNTVLAGWRGHAADEKTER
jgi:hypothetical protein